MTSTGMAAAFMIRECMASTCPVSVLCNCVVTCQFPFYTTLHVCSSTQWQPDGSAEGGQGREEEELGPRGQWRELQALLYHHCCLPRLMA